MPSVAAKQESLDIVSKRDCTIMVVKLCGGKYIRVKVLEKLFVLQPPSWFKSAVTGT